MCHRFVTFEIEKKDEVRCKSALDEYVRRFYRDDNSSMLYHKIQEDDELMSHMKGTGFSDAEQEKYMTLCMVYNPEKSNKKKQNSGNAIKDKMVYVDETDMARLEAEEQLGLWAREFNDKVGELFCVKRPRFSELRP